MKIIISESQHRRLFEEEQKVLHILGLKIFVSNTIESKINDVEINA